MAISEQQLNEVLATVIDGYKMKGSISTDAFFDVLEKLDLTPEQLDYANKTVSGDSNRGRGSKRSGIV